MTPGRSRDPDWRRAGGPSICKLCRKADDKDRYEKDPQRHAKVRRQRDAEILVWATALKEGAPCVDCGGSFHPAAMQWDHIGTDKRINISNAVHKGWSRARILTEIAKCELVCSNCHAVRTWTRRQQRDVVQLG